MKKKTTDHKELEGTYRPDREVESTEYGNYKFMVPKGLPERVRKQVKYLARELAETGNAMEYDQPAFDRMCHHMDVEHRAYEELTGVEGVTKDGHRGVTAKHPALQIQKDHSLAALKYEEIFKNRLKTARKPKKEKSEWDI